MRTEAIERALGVVVQELGAAEAYLKLGGEEPQSAEFLSVGTASGFRLVVRFATDHAPADGAALRLRQLADTFFASGLSVPPPPIDAERHLAQRRLDDELAALTGRTGATGATVIDVTSPVIWGTAAPRLADEDLDTFLGVAELEEVARKSGVDLPMTSGLVEPDRIVALEVFSGEQRVRLERLVARLADRPLASRRNYLLQARALSAVRSWISRLDGKEGSLRRLVHQDDLGYFARSFAGIYVLVLHFPGSFSELHVEALALHSLPVIERHVLALPPVDPTPPGGKVVKMPLPRS